MANDFRQCVFPSSESEIAFRKKQFPIKDDRIPKKFLDELKIVTAVNTKDTFSRMGNSCRQFSLTMAHPKISSGQMVIQIEHSTFNCGGCHASMYGGVKYMEDDLNAFVFGNVLDNFMSLCGVSSIYMVLQNRTNRTDPWGFKSIKEPRIVDGKLEGFFEKAGFKLAGLSCSGKHDIGRNGDDINMVHLLKTLPSKLIRVRTTICDFNNDRWAKEEVKKKQDEFLTPEQLNALQKEIKL